MSAKETMEQEHRDHYIRLAGITLAGVAVAVAWYFNFVPEHKQHLEGAMLLLGPALADAYRVRRRHKKVERESMAPPAE